MPCPVMLGITKPPPLFLTLLKIADIFDSESMRGVAQPGSALALGARSRRFKSSHPDDNAPVAHVDRASAF